MPASGRAAVDRAQGVRSTTKSSTTESHHKRDKTKSSQSYKQTLRKDTDHTLLTTSGPISTSRPSLKGRAYSEPLVQSTQTSGVDNENLADDFLGDEFGEGDEIVGDPFFQRFDITQSSHIGRVETNLSSGESSSDGEGPLSPTHVKSRSGAGADPFESPYSYLSGKESATMTDINIGVLGAPGVGKSSFIQRAFDLRTSAPSKISARKLSIEGDVRIVRLVEVPFDDVTIEDDDRIRWPDAIDDRPMPRIDGALTLYDIMNPESLEHVPPMLMAFHKASLPSVLVSCKCDNHPALRQVDPNAVERRAKSFLGEVSAIQVSHTAPETHQKCMSMILGAVIAARQAQSKNAATRHRANSSAARQLTVPRPSPAHKHERASSEFSGTKLKLQTPNPYEAEAQNHFPANSKTANQRHGTPQRSFLDLEESPTHESHDSEGETSELERQSEVDQPSDEKGYTFDQLVDRLLSQPLSKADTKFSAIFLALFRKFAAPRQLLDAIVRRFNAVDYDQSPKLLKTIAQLRHLTILEEWVKLYPGDFAHPSTRRKAVDFVSKLSGVRIYSLAAKEILADLEVVVEDDDFEWACCDKGRERSDTSKTFLSNSTTMSDASEDEGLSRDVGKLSIETGESGTQSILLSPSTVRSSTGSTSTSQTMLNTVEAAQRQAKLLTPIPRVVLSKLQWHQMMGETDESIARELTRMDWIMFSSIRPRDLVRHVSLSGEQKKRCKSLENVNRMIEHFNHLAYWVANFVLLRDKPKHRAMMLEKFMKVARKLRELNNYNALGAILAGINGTAVHRLSATRDLVSTAVQKDFMKLEILMSTQKSHFAYRLAWENSSAERIPYLPLLRRDLVSASEGNPTLLGDHRGDGLSAGAVSNKERINWRKFEIMGEVIVSVQRAQGIPYPAFPRNDEVRSFVLDAKIAKDDDLVVGLIELYERSIMLEPSAAASDRKRFNWFQR
ncbi:ras GEF [Patellaria atrata CBS 101060]|uniref:Ras GEF n=1 Tax=Patellaria atrata CBS 101060 TaxID=1346257 RepID=A0A9P4SBC5_9PEZI|nr:ras GEF [Patellaria atrata CBS 101060]